MIDWGIIGTIVGGGFGTTIFVLIVLAVVAWIVGLLVRRFAKAAPDDTKNSR